MKNLTRTKIEGFAKDLGFDLVGFSPARLAPEYLEVYERWLSEGLNADMDYMQKIEARRDLNKVLPGAKTVIVLAMNYYHDQEPLKENEGRIARYAYGRDYHKIIGKKLKQLEDFIDAPTKSYVDTGPILERAFAEQAGLGTLGKNGCLITQPYGSWVFLCEIITTLDLAEEPQPRKDLCGSCTRCIDACPARAIIAPGVVDARRCLSYLTIEHKGEIPPTLKKKITETKRIFGCDICQEVCPHNCRQVVHEHKDLRDPCIAGDAINRKDFSSLKDDQEFLKTYAGSPLMRPKREGIKRNLST